MTCPMCLETLRVQAASRNRAAIIHKDSKMSQMWNRDCAMSHHEVYPNNQIHSEPRHHHKFCFSNPFSKVEFHILSYCENDLPCCSRAKDNKVTAEHHQPLLCVALAKDNSQSPPLFWTALGAPECNIDTTVYLNSRKSDKQNP
ncbi:hypothetical protein O6P43_031795 [Quillaja saponaria]|uniref:Uncharacterized protein n=1 Tax=Quillaja saponaria TaxID=32244 RepID=A0AAD7P992_QUISA|nr:hypothetical protein O6P43_031795 [Quillaja saponaria]